MRKVSTALLIATTALALAGCSKEEAAAPAEAASEAAPVAATEAAPAASDTSAAATAGASEAAAAESPDPNGNPVKP